MGLDHKEITEGQGEAELWLLMTVRKYKRAGRDGEEERFEASLMNEAE